MAIELNELVGQDLFMEKVSPYINMNKCGLSPEGRPAGIFYLMGPTGVGKTFSVQSLAKAIHGSENRVLIINCAEFQMEHEVAKLIGAPPGYLGHRETQPVLTQQKLAAVSSSESAMSIVLFDEIEKAAGSLHRLLLGVMDNGTLKLADGDVVNFQNTLIFMSSNVGSNIICETMERSMGFGGEAKRNSNQVEKRMQKELQKAFSMEFLNRIDEIIQFHPLSPESVEKITNTHLSKLQTRVLKTQMQMQTEMLYTPEVVSHLAQIAYDPRYGAREVKRTVFRHVQSEVANIISSHPPNSIDKIEFDVQNGQMTIRVIKSGESTAKKESTSKSAIGTVGQTPVYGGGGKNDPAIKTAKKTKKNVKRSYMDLTREVSTWKIQKTDSNNPSPWSTEEIDSLT